MALRTPNTAMGVGDAAKRRMPPRARNQPVRATAPTQTMKRATKR
tara:strand:- start:386 stop:520 length:135 start_codon:yes stop_codon:yes gene_type:complete